MIAVNRFRISLRSLIAILLVTATSFAQSLEPETLRRKQEDQQRARTMTRELLGNVLDLQLRQLSENGLTDLPVFRDIQLMRGNLQHVVDAEMTKVVELLAAAQRQPAAERERSFIEARKMIRTVVVRLSAERQSLLRRLKVAELAEQARRLIRLQSDVQELAKSIPGEAKPRQEPLALKAREDQRDVKGLFFPLLETLDDVRTWGGPMAAVCQDGVRILQAAEVGKHLDETEAELAAEHFTVAAEHQDGALKGLRELLKLLDKTQGMLSGENRATIDRLHALAEKQERLRDETRKVDPSEPSPREAVEQQAGIHKELAELARSLPATPTAERLLEQAQIAAKDATTHLFEGHQQTAVAEQGQVLGNLAALEELLAAGANDAATDKTAAELADQVNQVAAVKEKLAQAEAHEQSAEKAASTDGKSAAAQELQAADTIADAKQAAALPDAVKSQLDNAEQAARSAQGALAQLTGKSTERTDKQIKDAQAALDRAQATVEAALKDAERRAAAVKIGELARAAEALERAAAEERAVAATAQTLPDDATASAMAAELSERQTEVADIARKLTAGLSQTAPEVSEQIVQAEQQVEQSRNQLADVARKPEAAGVTGKEAAKSALNAARQLAQAAKTLRADVAQTAKTLALHSGEEADALTAARSAVEDAMNDAIGTLSDRIERLQQAAFKTFDAAREQQQASGRPEAAAAMKRARQIGAALDDQFFVDAAADQNAMSPSVKSVAQQQAVAEAIDQARQAAQNRPAAKADNDALTQALTAAQQQAQAAAKSMLGGHTAATNEQRGAALQQLVNAMELATAEANRAAQTKPSAPPDLNAERAAQEAARDAQQLAAADAPSAGRSLEAAAKSAGEAVAALTAQQPQRAAGPQQETERALSAAQQQLDAALDTLRRAQAALLANQADAAQRLADRAAALDPDAMTALSAAADLAQAAQTAGKAAAPQAALEQPLARSAEKSLERAAATLAAKEQQVRRDQAVAEALAAVTERQQSAADLLDQLRGLAEAAMNAAEEPNAQTAAQAADDFAEAQRATGQGAVELSGQQQVVEPMLHQALQMAAALQSGRQAQSPAGVAKSEQMPDGHPPATTATDADAPGQLGKAAEDGAASEAPTSPDVGFVPQSPETTAKLMAGPQLTKAMQAAQQSAQQPANNSANAKPAELPPDANSNLAQNAKSQSTNPTNASQQGVQPGQEQQNAPLKNDLSKSPNDKPDPKPTATGARQGDAEGALRRLQQEPWFAKLPPELRKSIGAGAQQKPPRAYEERLRRYFQSVD